MVDRGLEPRLPAFQTGALPFELIDRGMVLWVVSPWDRAPLAHISVIGDMTSGNDDDVIDDLHRNVDDVFQNGRHARQRRAVRGGGGDSPAWIRLKLGQPD